MPKRRFLATALACSLGGSGLAATEPTAVKDPGLYLAGAADASAAPVKLRGTMPQVHPKGIAKTMLLMGHSKPTLLAVISGEKAEVRTTTASPAFSFYLPASAGGMDAMMNQMSGDGPPAQARSGSEFVLVHLRVNKDANREAEVGQQKGQRTKDVVACSSESLGHSLYRVTPSAPLAPGEYAFYWGEQGFGGMLWDFGVDER